MSKRTIQRCRIGQHVEVVVQPVAAEVEQRDKRDLGAAVVHDVVAQVAVSGGSAGSQAMAKSAHSAVLHMDKADPHLLMKS